MVSKLEILAYYLSLGLDLYFITSLALRVLEIANGTVVATNTEESTALTLDVISFGFALALLLLDITTLKSYYLENTKSEKGDRKMNRLAFAYVVDSKLEMLAIFIFISLLVATSATSAFLASTDTYLNIGFGVVDYAVVALRSTVRINGFSKDGEYDVFMMQYYDNLFPFTIIYFVLYSLYDIIQGIVLFPCTMIWSVRALCTVRWFPEFVDDGMFAPITSGPQAVT